MAYDANNDKGRPTMAVFASFATYSKICIGWILCLSMTELSIGVYALGI